LESGLRAVHCLADGLRQGCVVLILVQRVLEILQRLLPRRFDFVIDLQLGLHDVVALTLVLQRGLVWCPGAITELLDDPSNAPLVSGLNRYTSSNTFASKANVAVDHSSLNWPSVVV